MKNEGILLEKQERKVYWWQHNFCVLKRIRDEYFSNGWVQISIIQRSFQHIMENWMAR
jgi:hypothetical protein